MSIYTNSKCDVEPMDEDAVSQLYPVKRNDVFKHISLIYRQYSVLTSFQNIYKMNVMFSSNVYTSCLFTFSAHLYMIQHDTECDNYIYPFKAKTTKIVILKTFANIPRIRHLFSPEEGNKRQSDNKVSGHGPNDSGPNVS